MKHWITALLVVFAAGLVEAKPKPMNLKQYLETQKAQAEKKDKTFDQAASEEKFKKMDADGDGIVTPEEKAASKKKK